MMITLSSVALMLMLSGSCTTEGPADQEFPIGSLENPLILDDYSGIDRQITYQGTIGIERLYIKVINIPYLNDNHTVELVADNPFELYTYFDAFVTLQDSSSSSGGPVAFASCEGTTTAAGELHIMIDGTKATSVTSFILTAST